MTRKKIEMESGTWIDGDYSFLGCAVYQQKPNLIPHPGTVQCFGLVSRLRLSFKTANITLDLRNVNSFSNGNLHWYKGSHCIVQSQVLNISSDCVFTFVKNGCERVECGILNRLENAVNSRADKLKNHAFNDASMKLVRS